MTKQPRKRITIDAPSEAVILAARHLDATEGRVQVGAAVDASTRSAITCVLDYIAKAHNQTDHTGCGHEAELERLREELKRAQRVAMDVLDDGPLERVRNLHQPMQRGALTVCAHCSHWDEKRQRCFGVLTDYPCDTLRAAEPTLTPAQEARLATTGVHTPGCDCGHPGMGVSWHSDDCPWRRAVLNGSTPAPGCSPSAAETEPNNTTPASLRDQYTDAVECAIGLNVDCGGTEGVRRVRDAVLAVRDARHEALKRAHVALVSTASAAEQRADQLWGAIACVRHAVHIADTEDVTDWQRGFRSCAGRVLSELDQTREPTS